ncbi:MCE family protein [Nocardia sp. alder85J]|uniref:MCE family protein n=1 Tax=Nocardia sp. alder85J TaxID=2862949 RepID=UPI001CD81A68|nr:MCE family protein [Nocardia sp. alder85J]MCX4095210.1 MCE family protein [Nocardia sp. alder85J]
MSRLTRRIVLSLLLIAVVVVAGAAAGPFGGSGTVRVTAQFDSAAGLYAGNSVDVLGMKIGKVDSITQRGAYVEVRMSIQSSTPVPADVTAVTVSDSVLTDRHVELTPAYHGGPTLRDHAVLDPKHTRTPIEFDSVLAMADKLSKSLAGDGAGHGPIAGLVDVGAATAVHGDDIKSALDQLAAALRTGSDQGVATKDAVTKIVTDLDSLTTAAAANDQQIRDFGSGVHQLSDLLADQQLGSGDTGAKLNQILGTAADLMQRNRGSLNGTLGNANVMMQSLADYQRNIAEYMDLFPLVVDNAYAVMDPDLKVGRVHINADKVLFDGQMVKEVCNLLDMKQLGCNTGKMSDMGPDFGVVAMLAGIAGLPK